MIRRGIALFGEEERDGERGRGEGCVVVPERSGGGDEGVSEEW